MLVWQEVGLKLELERDGDKLLVKPGCLEDDGLAKLQTALATTFVTEQVGVTESSLRVLWSPGADCPRHTW
jgi:hypothetical protein